MLPNLPALNACYTWGQTFVPLTLGEWTLIAPADPQRWMLWVMADDANSFLVTPEPSDTDDVGFRLLQNDDLKIEYQKFGVVATVEWFAKCRFANANLTVLTVSIPKPKG